ncbi:MAG TPA: polysaccharide biosynthesis tyrosine autokinase [Stellaceae bacterium]|nr:polysaccharide biosynthesis tyrosine autokinase [Stellaceae bacterium]
MTEATSAPAAPYRAREAEAEAGFELRDALSFAWRHWKLMISVAGLAVFLGAVYLLQQTPIYVATAQVLLDRQPEKTPGLDGIANAISLDSAMLENQIAIIQSAAFLRRVAERAHLTAETISPRGRPQTSLFSPLVRLLQRQAEDAPGSKPMPTDEMRTVAALKAALRVSRASRDGYVLDISIASTSPGRAAELANAIADTYLVDKLDTRYEAARRASAWLSDRLVGLRKQVQESEEAVVSFRAAHGLVQSGGVTLDEQQLAKLNAALIDAKADLAQKKAQVQQLAALQARGGNLGDLPAISEGGSLGNLRQQAAELSAKEADLLTRYSTAHPLVVNVRAQLGDVKRSIAAEVQRLAASVRNQYELALARVGSLETSLRRASGQSSLDDATAIQLRDLERTAAVNKALFEDFLKDAKIAGEQATFEPQDVRIITPAAPPTVAAYPRRGRFMTLSLFLGLLAGIGAAAAKDKLQSGFMTPKQVEDVLGLPVLASLYRLAQADLKLEGRPVAIYRIPAVKPLSRHAEAIRTLRSGVHMSDVDRPPVVVQVTSAVPGEGKTTIALSLAASAAAAKLRTLLVDADLRHPTVSQVCFPAGAVGLVDVLLGDVAAAEAVAFWEEAGHWVLGAGNHAQSPPDLLGSERMRALVAEFREDYDLVILDTPPVGPVSDPVVVSRLSDTAVLAVRWGATAREMVKQAVVQLSPHCKIAGVALNQVQERRAEKYGKYAYAFYYGRRHYKNYYSG